MSLKLNDYYTFFLWKYAYKLLYQLFSPFQDTKWTDDKETFIKIAAIDNGLAFPFKHPDEWRACEYLEIFIESLVIPFSEQDGSEMYGYQNRRGKAGYITVIQAQFQALGMQRCVIHSVSLAVFCSLFLSDCLILISWLVLAL